jgi:hypothetical protein
MAFSNSTMLEKEVVSTEVMKFNFGKLFLLLCRNSLNIPLVNHKNEIKESFGTTKLKWFKLQRRAIWLFQINFIKGFPWGHNLGEAFFLVIFQ